MHKQDDLEIFVTQGYHVMVALDVAILVALEEEFREIEAELSDRWEPRANRYDGGYDYFWADERSRYRCVATFVGKMGPQEAVLGARRLLRFEPAVVVNIGIAAGLHNDICIGDVVVPDLVQAYDKTSKAVEDEDDDRGWTWQARPDAFRAEHALVEEAKHFRMARRASFLAWEAAGGSDFTRIETANLNVVAGLLSKVVIRERPQIRVAPLASGCFVVAARSFAEWIRNQNGDLMATEMEAAGMMLSATKQRAHVQTLVIRGISDHVGVPKSETDQIQQGALRGLAMRNAWRLFRAYLDEGLLPRASPSQAPEPSDTASSERLAALEHGDEVGGPGVSRAHSRDDLERPFLSSLGATHGEFTTNLIHCLAEGYPDIGAARALWRRAGGFAREVENISRPVDLWQRLWQLSLAGASVRPASLLRAALEDLPNNEVLLTILAEVESVNGANSR